MKGTPARHLSSAISLALLAISLSACKGGTDTPPDATSNNNAPDREWTDAARVEAMASKLQACSYEGKPVDVEAGQLNAQAPADCKTMVEKIMAFTGLPANFVVTAGPVPNALAVILLDDQRMAQRVIAFNPNFIDATQRVTGGGQWGPTSIMAHEIGHHLSGHTITAGGSRPGIELEADKFSGYVLYKMGAPLAEATKAIDSLGSDTELATHPAKSRRIAAITEGWQEACRQTGGNCSAGAATTTPPAQTGAPTAAKVALPAPSSQSIPFKYGQFIVDETGKLDPAIVAEKDKELYALARDRGAEIVYLIVDDLHGLSADEYALTMMRQLRVGKLDIGNGAVFVVAPRQRQAGAALGPGIAKSAEFTDIRKTLLDWTDAAWKDCDDTDGCKGWTKNLLDSFFFMRKWIEDASWSVTYPSLNAVMEAPESADQLGKLVRFEGTVTTLSPPDGIGKVNRRLLDSSKIKYQPVGLKTDDGLEVIAYVDPTTTTLMPSGAMKEGSRYTMVGRLHSRGDGKAQASSVWLFSYEPTG